MFDVHPFTLLLFVLVVVACKNVVSAIGKPALQDVAWTVYIWAASKMGHAQLTALQEKKQQHAEITRQKKQTSAQDEYAKWTKLNRQADKLVSEISQLNDSIASTKTVVSKYTGTFITVSTSLPIWFCRAWFRKSVLFYLPVGVLPHYVEWALALPFFPTGSVGLTMWMFALNYVFGSLVFGITFLLSPSVSKPLQPAASNPAPTSADSPDKSRTEPSSTPQQGPEPEVTAEKIK